MSDFDRVWTDVYVIRIQCRSPRHPSKICEVREFANSEKLRGWTPWPLSERASTGVRVTAPDGSTYVRYAVQCKLCGSSSRVVRKADTMHSNLDQARARGETVITLADLAANLSK